MFVDQTTIFASENRNSVLLHCSICLYDFRLYVMRKLYRLGARWNYLFDLELFSKLFMHFLHCKIIINLSSDKESNKYNLHCKTVRKPFVIKI